jgi:hypothetical protein
VSNLSFWASGVGNCLRIAEFGLLKCGCHERLVLKFSFFCLLMFDRLLRL